ncbi:MAG: choice-of-anchor N protein [Thermodesulfobacteriota bacterium]|nr:MAG: choice-of-anchor N protein [Thermodesulfobacteriota bacterium]
MLAKIKYSMLAVAAVLMLGFKPTVSHAVPALQLDIEGGSYDFTTETIVANSDPFTLYAFLSTNNYNLLSDSFYLSVAVLPSLEYDPAGFDLGSFSLNGTSYNVTSDMYYGTPPVEEYYNTFDGGDLAPHGVFPTYFYEHEFQFDGNDTTARYNTQDRAITGTIDTENGLMYYVSFSIDTTRLASDYVLHFDLYNTKVKRGGDIDISMFAPFSHDAESSRKVPEPGTLILLGSGLVGFYVHGRMRKKRS